MLSLLPLILGVYDAIWDEMTFPQVLFCFLCSLSSILHSGVNASERAYLNIPMACIFWKKKKSIHRVPCRPARRAVLVLRIYMDVVARSSLLGSSRVLGNILVGGLVENELYQMDR